jgi:alkylated DNA repair dioxygenase AlkB
MIDQTNCVQLNLFDVNQQLPKHHLIRGLVYVEDFIYNEKQEKLLETIDSQAWIMDLKRRVQHYGYRYNYKSRSIDLSMYLGELPEWAGEIAQQIKDKHYIDVLPDQVIVNEYQPGQGISPHIDCESCFTDTIISLSLGSSCIMEFVDKSRNEQKSLFLKSGSLLILKGEARYQWMHGIKPRKADKWQEEKIQRKRRVSLTFRKTICSR